MIPTGRQVALWVLPLCLAVLAVAVPPVVWVVVALDLLLGAGLLLDALLSRGQVRIERTLPAVAAVGEMFEVHLAVDNTGPRALQLRIQDEAPGTCAGLPLEATLGGGHGADLSYQVTLDRRGRHSFEGFVVRWRSPLGLWERQTRVDQPAAVRVYPDFRQLRRLGLASDLLDRKAPAHARRRRGGENEFQRLRPYVRGDAFRHIDWRATARRSHLVTREYGQESNQNVIFLLDAGRSMSADYGELSAFDHALNAALMMGQTALRKGDRVGLLAYDNEVRTWIPPRGGRRSGGALIRSTYDLFPSLREPDHNAAFRHLAGRVRRRSLVVVFTAVLDTPNVQSAARLWKVLGRRHLPLIVWMRDPAIESALQSEDPFERGAAAEIATWRRHRLREARLGGASVVDAEVGALTPALLNRYLEIKARRLL